MNVGEPPQPSAATPIVLALVFGGLAAALGAVASIYMWDPSETCRTRGGGSLTGEGFLWNPLCSDGSTVQPIWMTLSTAAALIVAVTCVVIAASRQVERDGQEIASPDVLHDYSRQTLPEDNGLRKLGDEW
ncbi:hypothetical protein C5C74_08015 [Rathayibacter sp. AY1E8]|uniref:hypothetical protein n=5 Tax=Rathayibacter TaxID=33886 RepID=UPI000CE8FA6C|nr:MULTISPECIES: hypothetical protein [unclassified Rathayibacter]PPF11445.1 hypothetical protein C5B98_08595 [Rathayibacter sp. AY1A5]PPF54363.1 hypothetical protein C5C55_11945 [Rathayibacter sp. AY1C2]PPG19029.1 hypothetical protein C5C74_08015 [Rathayibacter sp. AY1E8]PPG57908.1 hypothetical protein C5C69_13760 [Rathayibacter sp. AY1C7]PPG81839.1 hypothetical protein C5C29_15140 [Rathayibacter sp. AY1H2]PPH36831.1 hypothetical protein C5C86_15765 [Rathayibacter sp. AY1E4]PPH45709.1 hypot